MLVFLSVIENIVVLCPSFLLFSPTRTQFYSQLKRAVEPRKNFIMPGHYKKIMPAQQPIRAHVLLQPYNNVASFFLLLCSSRKYPCLPQGRLMEIPRGRGVSKAQFFVQKYDTKMEFPEGWWWGVWFKLRNLLWEGYGYFLEQYIPQPYCVQQTM